MDKASRYAVVKEDIFAAAKMIQNYEGTVRAALEANDSEYKRFKAAVDTIFDYLSDVINSEEN